MSFEDTMKQCIYPKGINPDEEEERSNLKSKLAKENKKRIKKERKKKRDMSYKDIARKFLGRDLLPGEHVHHINCDPLDNSPKNLYVCNATNHWIAHGSLLPIVKPLLESGIIVFDTENGVYILT